MNGIDCFFEGLRLVRQPGLRQYVIVPIIINAIVLVSLLSYGISQYDLLLRVVIDWLPEWLQFLSWLVGLIAAIVLIALGIYCFSIVANIIASPFNAVLSVKIEERLVPGLEHPTSNPLFVITRAIGREIRKLLYFLPRFFGLLVLSFIPGVNAIAPFARVSFGAWVMAIQYCDYAADNNQISFDELKRRLGQNRMQACLFGVLVYILIAIPVLNLVLIPVAVAGGTVFSQS